MFRLYRITALGLLSCRLLAAGNGISGEAKQPTVNNYFVQDRRLNAVVTILKWWDVAVVVESSGAT